MFCLPEKNRHRHFQFARTIALREKGDNAIYIRNEVTCAGATFASTKRGCAQRRPGVRGAMLFSLVAQIIKSVYPDFMTEGALYVRSRQPLYMQAAGQIRLKIEKGEWAPGGQLPVIEELQAEFGLSRSTIREALDMLEVEGLIERHRGRGTFVRSTLPERRSHVLPTRWNDLVAGLQTLRPEMIAPIAEEDGAALRTLLAGTATGPYVRFQRVHRRGAEPYCLIDIHLRKDVFNADAESFTRDPVVLVLAKRHPELVAGVRQRVTFSNADERTARALGIALGAPVVEILRTMTDPDETVVSHTYARYPGEYVRLDFDFDLDGTPRAARGED